jgi:hypothetical protein
MNSRKYISNYYRLCIAFAAILALPIGLSSQSLVNGDLEDEPGFSIAPEGWLIIPYTDPNCEANAEGPDTPDILYFMESDPWGASGYPYSGQTFVSGTYGGADSASSFFQEGIMQEVSDFAAGETYFIEFYQGVVKNEGAEDTAGSWIIYQDTTLIGISEPTVDYRAFNDPEILWECRSIIFDASSENLNLKFLPFDDDEDVFAGDPWNELSALRMGIDYVTLGHIPEPLSQDSLIVCASDSLILSPNLVDTANYLWSTGETTPLIQVFESGTYWINQSFGCVSYTDSIFIEVIPDVSVDLGEDAVICEDEEITLQVENSDSFYVWSTGSSDSSITVNDEGWYWVEVTGSCNSARDSIFISSSPEILISLGNDTTICMGDTLLLDAYNPNSEYLWQDGSAESEYPVFTSGIYSVFVQNEACNAFSEIFIDVEICVLELNVPNIITPNGDNLNDILIAKADGILSATWEIRNRWGQLVHMGESDGIHDQLILWDPANDLSQGTYFISIKYTGENGRSGQINQDVTITY